MSLPRDIEDASVAPRRTGSGGYRIQGTGQQQGGAPAWAGTFDESVGCGNASFELLHGIGAQSLWLVFFDWTKQKENGPTGCPVIAGQYFDFMLRFGLDSSNVELLHGMARISVISAMGWTSLRHDR